MQTITKVTGVDSKAGRRSRTGSTITMGIDDLLAIQCQQYFLSQQAGKEPTGEIKKIELIIYTDEDLNSSVMEKLEENLDEVLKEDDHRDQSVYASGAVNEPELKIFEKDGEEYVDIAKDNVECQHAFVNGRCANCGMVE